MDRGNNLPDGEQNNIMAQALAALTQALGNLQPAPVQAPREQNIAQVPKFHGYRNEDPAEWAKRFDATCLTNNWRLNRQKDIAGSFLDEPAFQWFDENYNGFDQWYTNGANNNLRDLLIAKYTTIAMKNKWQIEYRNIRQGPTEMVDVYAARFRKAISKAEMGNLLPNQMQVMDFVAGLRPKLAIITNGSNPADLDEAEETAKNVESASLINKNVIAAATNPSTAEVKELKAQILELKAEIKEAKYTSREDRKPPQNNGGNRKPPYRGPNQKPVDKRNLEYFNYRKKGHFKSECRAKPKDQTRDRIDYKNIRFLESEQPENES